jgi:predicted enzyme related to lactoylglutathione lyase
MPGAKIAYVVLDTVDPRGLAPFWTALLGVEVVADLEDGTFVVLGSETPGATALALQRVPEPRTGKNRMHLDVVVDDLEAATMRITELGGVWLDGETRELGGYRWRCMADPEGNEFDIVPDDD